MSNHWSGQRLPHPARRLPIAGDVLAIDPRAPVQRVMRHAPLGPLFEIKIFGQRLVFVTTAELAAELCDESRFQKANSPAVDALRAFAGDGLFTAHNDEPNWRLAHDLLLPAFTKGAMRGYHPAMVSVSDELLARWDTAARPVDVARDMTAMTLETIGRAAFSQAFGSFEHPEPHPFAAAMVSVLKEGRRAGALGAMPGAGALARLAERRYRGHLGYAQGFVDDIIASRRNSGDDRPDDLLGLMLNTVHQETGERLDDENIRYQILTFLVAGHETTSGALSFALYYLTRHPEAMRNATAEVDAALGPNPDAVPAFEQVAKFRYLRRVLDEALRLWPTAPAFARSPRAETVIGGRYRMTPDDCAILLLPQIQRDPAVWGPDAGAFDPDRFLPENARGRAPHAHKVFGTGERSCIGRQFALHEAALVLARLLRRYTLTPEPGYELRIAERLTLMPEGFRLRVRPRRYDQASFPNTGVRAPAISGTGPRRHAAGKGRPGLAESP